jgi:ribosome-binding factor A
MKNNPPSQRQLRVGEQLKQIISETMRRGHFRNEALIDFSLVTVTEVRVSPDLKKATAYVLALGGDNMETVLRPMR